MTYYYNNYYKVVIIVQYLLVQICNPYCTLQISYHVYLFKHLTDLIIEWDDCNDEDNQHDYYNWNDWNYWDE